MFFLLILKGAVNAFDAFWFLKKVLATICLIFGTKVVVRKASNLRNLLYLTCIVNEVCLGKQKKRNIFYRI